MLSKNKRIVQVQVTKDTFDYITLFCKMYNISISSFCSDCITQYILFHDHKSLETNNRDDYFKKLANFIRLTYNEKRKNRRFN